MQRKDGRTEWRTKQTLNAPLPFYGGGIKMPYKQLQSPVTANFSIHLYFTFCLLPRNMWYQWGNDYGRPFRVREKSRCFQWSYTFRCKLWYTGTVDKDTTLDVQNYAHMDHSYSLTGILKCIFCLNNEICLRKWKILCLSNLQYDTFWHHWDTGFRHFMWYQYSIDVLNILYKFQRYTSYSDFCVHQNREVFCVRDTEVGLGFPCTFHDVLIDSISLTSDVANRTLVTFLWSSSTSAYTSFIGPRCLEKYSHSSPVSMLLLMYSS